MSSGLQIQVLEFWLEQRWLVPEETEGQVRFNESDMARAQLIRQLKEDFGSNDEGIDIILHLLDQIHGLRGLLVELRDRMSSLQT